MRAMDRGAEIGEDPWIVNRDAIDFVQEVEVNEDAEDANFSADNALENQTDGCLAEEQPEKQETLANDCSSKHNGSDAEDENDEGSDDGNAVRGRRRLTQKSRTKFNLRKYALLPPCSSGAVAGFSFWGGQAPRGPKVPPPKIEN